MSKIKTMSQYRIQFGIGLMAAVLCLLPNRADAAFVISYGAAGAQTSTVAGVTTENFNGFATGSYTNLNTAVGTLTATTPGLAIVAADLYGGAGNTGGYFAVGAETGSPYTLEATLTPTSALSYFGMWLSAADVNNSVEFYSGATLVGTLTVDAALLADPSFTSNFNGNTIDKAGYVNVTGTAGTTFDKIVFKNAITGSGLEADNFSVLAANAPPTNPVPEPTTMTLGLIGSLTGAGLLRLRRKIIG